MPTDGQSEVGLVGDPTIQASEGTDTRFSPASSHSQARYVLHSGGDKETTLGYMELSIGPWPDPQSMVRYREADPSFPNRYVTAWEQEGAHRRSMELQEQQHRMGLEEKEMAHRIAMELAGAKEAVAGGIHARRFAWAGFALAGGLASIIAVAGFVLSNSVLFGVLAGTGGIGVGVRVVQRRIDARKALGIGSES